MTELVKVDNVAKSELTVLQLTKTQLHPTKRTLFTHRRFSS
jgi:hypothetical protein